MGRSQGRGSPGCVGLATLAALLVGSVAARAADACGPQPDDHPARVLAVTDDLDVAIDDGRILRLAGVALPRPDASRPERAAEARRALETWIDGRPVSVRVLAAAPDRWGRVAALLFRPDAAEPSAARALVAAGLARAAPETAIHPCFGDLLGAEAAARAADRGLWSDPREAVLRSEDHDGLAQQSGGFAIVEGTLGVRDGRGGTLYLTLGRDRWGFAAVVSRRDAERLAKGGLDVRDYAGTPVRLRGDLDDRFGPRLRLTDPDQFESLEPGALAEPAAAVQRSWSDPIR